MDTLNTKFFCRTKRATCSHLTCGQVACYMVIKASQEQSLRWRVLRTTLGPPLSIGSSGSTGKPPRRLPRMERDRSLRRCIPTVYPPLLFGILHMKMDSHLYPKAMKIRFGKICRTQRTIETATTTMTSHHPTHTKSLAPDDVCHVLILVGKQRYVIIRYNRVFIHYCSDQGNMKNSLQKK